MSPFSKPFLLKIEIALAIYLRFGFYNIVLGRWQELQIKSKMESSENVADECHERKISLDSEKNKEKSVNQF